MGLILCEDCAVNTPLQIDNLGVRIFSLEELCYVIHEYPLIVLDDFVNDDLMNFLREDLNLGIQAILLEKRKTGGISDDDVLLSILAYSDYYTPAEIDKYRMKLITLRSLPSYELSRQKGDFFFGVGMYGKAINHYISAQHLSDETKVERSFTIKILDSIGCAYANLFEYENAFEAFKKAYELSGDKKYLKRFYFLSAMDPLIEHKERYLALLPNGTDINWNKEYEIARHEIARSEELERISAFKDRDSVRKRRLIENEIKMQKNIYRQMI